MASRRPADWRFPTPKQARAEETARRMRDAAAPATTRTDEECWWDAFRRTRAPRRPGRRRRGRSARSGPRSYASNACAASGSWEIARADAMRLHGADAQWRDVGGRLLADGCQIRTGRHEEDGCWPDFR